MANFKNGNLIIQYQKGITLKGPSDNSFITYDGQAIKPTSPFASTVDVNILDTTSLTLTSNNLGQLIVNTSDATGVETIITVPSDTNDNLPVGFTCRLSRTALGELTVVADGGVTIVSVNSNLSLAEPGSTAVLTKIAANTWQLSGGELYTVPVPPYSGPTNLYSIVMLGQGFSPLLVKDDNNIYSEDVIATEGVDEDIWRLSFDWTDIWDNNANNQILITDIEFNDGTSWISYLDDTYWNATPNRFTWTGSAWVSDQNEYDGDLEVTGGTPWIVGFRPTHLRVTYSVIPA